MSLAEHHDMIKTFAPDRTDQPFSMSVLPWRSRRRWPVTYAHRAHPFSQKCQERSQELAGTRSAISGWDTEDVQPATPGMRTQSLRSTAMMKSAEQILAQNCSLDDTSRVPGICACAASEVLLTAIARARSWMNDLSEGRVNSFKEIARIENKVECHNRRLIILYVGALLGHGRSVLAFDEGYSRTQGKNAGAVSEGLVLPAGRRLDSRRRWWCGSCHGLAAAVRLKRGAQGGFRPCVPVAAKTASWPFGAPQWPGNGLPRA